MSGSHRLAVLPTLSFRLALLLTFLCTLCRHLHDTHASVFFLNFGECIFQSNFLENALHWTLALVRFAWNWSVYIDRKLLIIQSCLHTHFISASLKPLIISYSFLLSYFIENSSRNWRLLIYTLLFSFLK